MQPTSPRFPDIKQNIRILVCPHCGYSLRGLPVEGACPECGCTYDGDTFVLTGIARGMSTMQFHRKLLWIFVAAGAWLGSALVPIVYMMGTQPLVWLSIMALAWGGVLIYLLVSGQHGKKAKESYLFTASGFGVIDPSTEQQDQTRRFQAWSEVDHIRVDRLGQTWHRLRIGKSTTSGKRLSSIALDVNVLCDQTVADFVKSFCERQIDNAANADHRDLHANSSNNTNAY